MTLFQLDMKGKVLEARFQEEKLRLQQKHDATVQKVQIKVLIIDFCYLCFKKILIRWHCSKWGLARYHGLNGYLTYWGWHKMVAILQVSFIGEFLWQEISECCLEFNRNLFWRVELIGENINNKWHQTSGKPLPKPMIIPLHPWVYTVYHQTSMS